MYFAEPLITSGFASGVARYEDAYPGVVDNARIVLAVTIEGQLTTEAIVDTGAPYCILDPQIVEQLGISANAGYASDLDMMIRGSHYEGRLHRLQIGLRAECIGTDLEVDATVFVPAVAPGDQWRYPNFLGLNGLLNRIRFAVDPAENAFYFGPI